jgi:hypothetical protein
MKSKLAHRSSDIWAKMGEHGLIQPVTVYIEV